MPYKVQRCQSVKISKLPPSIEIYHNSLQEDYKVIMKFLIEASGMGHLVWNDDIPTIIEPKSPNPILVDIIEILGKGGTAAENCYGLFYKNKKSNTKPTRKSKEYNFTASLLTIDDIEFNKKVKKINALAPEQWLAYRKQLTNENFEQVWKEIAEKIGNPNKGVKCVDAVKDMFPVVSQPDNHDYCTALTSMVVSSFGSWCECHKNHVDGTIELEEKLKDKQNEAFCSLLSYSEALEKNNYGLTKKVLKTVLMLIRESIEPEPFFLIPFKEIEKPAYHALVKMDYKEIFAAYNNLKTHWKLKNRKKYISMPKLRDYQIPFGLTGRGMKFDLSVNNNAITVKVGETDILCLPSHYFHDLQVQKVITRADKKKDIKSENKFILKFRHKLKDKKKDVYKDWITAEVKEVKIQKKENGEYYLYLPYTIMHDDYNFNLAKFFMSANPKTTEFQSALVAGFDLNLSTPIVATFAKWNGQIDPVFTQTEILRKDTYLSNKIRKLVKDFKSLIEVIRDYKTSIKNKITLNKKSLDFLNQFDLNGDCRYKIQIIIAIYKRKKAKLFYQCRKNGHNNLSENLRLLELIDAYRSVSCSYRNISNFDQKTYTYLNVDKKRENFREFVSKQFGAVISQYCFEKSINVAFIEDLEIKADFDNDRNSLGRLFAAGQLKKAIEGALNKLGIGCSFVNPMGTSRTDPVGGMHGYRHEKYKTLLYVLRDGELGKVHSDVAASLNVLLQGLSHSVYPYKFWVKNGKVAKDGKRMDAFLNKRKLIGKSVTCEDYTGYVYTTPIGFITEKEKENHVKQIKHLSTSEEKIKSFELTGCSIESYKAFLV